MQQKQSEIYALFHLRLNFWLGLSFRILQIMLVLCIVRVYLFWLVLRFM